VDNPKTITHLGLCAGYGGIELGLHRVIRNLRTVALCEIETFACANLVAKMEAGLMDAAPIWTDLKSFPWAEFRDRVDILTGGYPCQPFSAAGKRLGTDDPRHLWPFIADGIRILRPKLCFFENVEGHISLGLREVIGELESIGYKAAWGIFSAAEVGAPHQRKRIFILAYRKDIGLPSGINAESKSGAEWRQRLSIKRSGCDAGCGELADSCHGSNPAHGYAEAHRLPSEYRTEVCYGFIRGTDATAWPSRPGEPQHGWEPPRVVANGNGSKRRPDNIGTSGQGEQETSEVGACCGAMGNANSQRPQERQGQRGAGIQGTHANGGADADGQTQPKMGGDADGIAGGMGYAELQVTCDNRTDELRLLGNGVVPATAERAFRILMEELI